jgi:hypothetical protein
MAGARQPGTTHRAVGRVGLEGKDVAVEVASGFMEGPLFNVVFNGHGYNGLHPGYIGRVPVTPKSFTLGDYKEGHFKHDIDKLRRDRKTKDPTEPQLKDPGGLEQMAEPAAYGLGVARS